MLVRRVRVAGTAMLGCALLLFQVSCASTASARQSSVDDGWLLPGPRAVAAFALDSNVRIRETIPSAVPRVVRAAAAVRAREIENRPECSRFFQTRTSYVVVFAAFCGMNFGKMLDSRLIAAFAANGTKQGEVWWTSDPGVAELQPAMRFGPSHPR
jgi:hypothetical protein